MTMPITSSRQWGIQPMPTALGRIRFRLRHVESINRYAIERYCSVNGWIPIHYDDFASHAFLQVKAIAKRSYGHVVCAKCREELENPQISHAGVLCQRCERGGSLFSSLRNFFLLRDSSSSARCAVNYHTPTDTEKVAHKVMDLHEAASREVSMPNDDGLGCVRGLMFAALLTLALTFAFIVSGLLFIGICHWMKGL